MPSRFRVDLSGIVYHLPNYGPGPQAIFHTPADHAAAKTLITRALRIC
jgi:hypothetical protein